MGARRGLRGLPPSSVVDEWWLGIRPRFGDEEGGLGTLHAAGRALLVEEEEGGSS
jgi:hypothetical protein